MGKINLITTNFTAGEISPRLMGRVDISRYANGVKRMENAFPVIQGGAMRRYGLRFYAEVKDSTKPVRLVPYIFNRSQAYVLEFGDSYMRVFREEGQVTVAGVPYEIATPFDETQVQVINYVQSADTMFMAHPDSYTQRLQRYAVDQWVLADAPFDVEPFDELGMWPAVAVTLSSAAVGAGVTATAGASVWLASDVGREIISGAGLAVITAYTSTTVVTIEILQAFASTMLASGAWNLAGSPQTKCTCNKKEPVGDAVTLTLAADGWRSDDVGKYVRINRGLVKITGYTSATIVDGEIRALLDATVGAPANSWSLNSSVWNSRDGYPGACTMFEQRLVLGGSNNYPQTVWLSRIDVPLNFELGTLDDDAASFTLASDQINPIAHLAQVKVLAALTYGGEFTMTGGVEKPLTPTNVQIKQQSVYGCGLTRPVRIGNELLFWQRAGRKLRAMAYRFDQDTFAAPDLAVLGEHLTDGGIVDMAYQQEPESIVWAVRADGMLISMTLDRDQDVIGWARHTTDGAFEHVTCIPGEDGRDQVWVVVRRTINGTARRYIERMDPDLHTDSAIVGTAGTPTNVWTGLGHLEGKTVTVKADGVVIGSVAVASGQVVLERAASAVEIGLPYTSQIVTLTPEVQGARGTSQGARMRTSKLTLRLLDTVGCSVNGKPLAFRTFGVGVLDQPPQPFTGDKEIPLLGFEDGVNEITIEQDQPYPWHILALIREATIND